MKRIPLIAILLLVLLAALPGMLAADTVTILDDQDEDSLFGGDAESADTELVTEIKKEDTASGIETMLLTSEQLVWSGRLSFAFLSSWLWQHDVLDFPYLVEHFTEPATALFSPTLAFALAFDARPDANFRVMGKANITYPLDPAETPEPDTVFHITELFADYNWDDRLFFRVGKHTIKWGVGYSYSPADILNITPIDPADPEAEREGPLSIKINYPVGLDNLYLYVIANNITAPGGIAFAPKWEWVIGDTEIGLGGFYRPDLAVRPRLMATATFKLFDFDMFGEAVASYGTERIFIREDSTAFMGVTTATDTETPFFDATLGLRYSYDNEEQNLHLSFFGQYFYNGDGYTDPDFLNDHAAGVLYLKSAQAVSDADLDQAAQHYGVHTGSIREIGGSDYSLSCSWRGASDGTGILAPALSLEASPDIKLTLTVPVAYGKTGNGFMQISPDLTIRLFEKTKINLTVPLYFQENADNVIIWKSAQVLLGFSLEQGIF